MAKPEPRNVRLVELSDVILEKVGGEKWRVSVVTVKGAPIKEVVLEKGMSLPAARMAAMTWRARNPARLP